jgi:hypothetical protein
MSHHFAWFRWNFACRGTRISPCDPGSCGCTVTHEFARVPGICASPGTQIFGSVPGNFSCTVAHHLPCEPEN